ncbi:MAG: LamG-like jellyroll fold domain-containing protein [Euryarchaeota archaeon]|nr:LamG-like jellyroll fold domain-containing protein [Euryarchaeota archaeon]
MNARGTMNARRSIQGKWCSMAVLTIFAAVMLAASIAPALASPLVGFTPPTPANGSIQSATNVEMNVSITESNLDKVKFNWNGTNFTLYDHSSLMLMYNFDNVSALGEYTSDTDGCVKDLSGYGNNGTLGNDTAGTPPPTWNSSGKYGGTFVFNGVNTSMTTNKSLLNNLSQFTLSGWVKPSEERRMSFFGQNNVIEFGFVNGSSISAWAEHSNNNKGGSIQWIFEQGTFKGTWHFVCFVGNATNISLYVDGALKSSDEVDIDPTIEYGTSNDSFNIGYGVWDSDGDHFNGSIDEVRVWDRSLSDDEVYQQYISNLNKYNSSQWYLYVNQSKNANAGLDNGTYTYQAFASNTTGNEDATEERTVTIGSDTKSPVITIDAPTQSSPANRTGGEQIWVNFTYAEPCSENNYTVTIGNATAVINSTKHTGVAGGTNRTANESFNLNTSAADGLYNVTVEMYNCSSNYSISHQNNSVRKGSYNASIISQPENRTTEPSVNATYELKITNTGSFTGTFVLAVTNLDTADVAALNKTQIKDLASGASQSVTLNVKDSTPGTYNVTVNVTSTHSGSKVAETNITTTVVSPGQTLTLGNVTDITSDWGRSFNLNHSVAVTNATASNVNVTYNVPWITDNITMGTIAKDGVKWHNQSIENSIVQKITVTVDATTTTTSTTNDSETFSINITKRAINITADPVTSQSVNSNTTFWINGSADGEYAETFIGKADLIRAGSVIRNQTISDGNANFSRTESTEGTFNFSIRFYNTTHYNNNTTNNATMHIVGDTPPASITGLNSLTEQSRIRWTWTDPADADFAEVMIYLDGILETNVSRGVQNYTATGLTPNTEYTIGTHTVDDKGNINRTWVNDTVRTLPLPGLQRINVTPTAWTLNISESVNFNATGYDHNNDSIDPANLTFGWGTAPAGVGTLNATTGSVVNFKALHTGRTEICTVNGNVSSNETYEVWITVNTPPETEDVTNGTGNATSGSSTAIVMLNNGSVNGTITIEEIGDPINGTEDSGNRTGLGTDSIPVKGANVTVNGSIKAALNDTGGYVHIRIGYNESQLGNIDENALYIYKFVNGTGWVKLVKGKPSYCIANGRNTTANYVWVNVTECSRLLLAGSPKATPTPPRDGGSGGGSGGSGTYPPGWFTTPTPTVTATKAPTASTTATAATPGKQVTPVPTKAKPTAIKATTPVAEGATAGTAKKSAPGFTAVFVIAGMLAVAYAMMRRRE